MMKISERCRKILRNVFRGIGVSVVSLIIQACYGILPPDEPCEYGMPYPEYGMPVNQETSIYGKVVAKETGKPIFGIEVSIEETEYCKRTYEDGYFNFLVPVQIEYKLKFKDVDGPYNDGLFKEQIWTLKQNDTNKTLLIGMDLETETNAE